MKKLILALALVSITSGAMAQTRLVYCTQFGVLNGPVVTFKNFCPLGWVPV